MAIRFGCPSIRCCFSAIEVRLESTCGTLPKKESFERNQCRQNLPILPPMEKLKAVAKLLSL